MDGFLQHLPWWKWFNTSFAFEIFVTFMNGFDVFPQSTDFPQESHLKSLWPSWIVTRHFSWCLPQKCLKLKPIGLVFILEQFLRNLYYYTKGAFHFYFPLFFMPWLCRQRDAMFFSPKHSKISCRIFCLQWRGTCRKHFNVKIKMASTFSFINIKLLKVSEYWRGV